MLEQTERITHEVEHGKKIQADADKVWGWDSKAGRLRATRRANYFIELGGFNAETVALDLGCARKELIEQYLYGENREPAVFYLDGREHLKLVKVHCTDPDDYTSLLKNRGREVVA